MSAEYCRGVWGVGVWGWVGGWGGGGGGGGGGGVGGGGGGWGYKPTLFNAYVDDMQSFVNEEPSIKIGGQIINHLLQADDLILVSETSVGLRKLLDKLTKYCRRWHLILNVKKTKTMIFQSQI